MVSPRAYESVVEQEIKDKNLTRQEKRGNQKMPANAEVNDDQQDTQEPLSIDDITEEVKGEAERIKNEANQLFKGMLVLFRP